MISYFVTHFDSVFLLPVELKENVEDNKDYVTSQANNYLGDYVDEDGLFL